MEEQLTDLTKRQKTISKHFYDDQILGHSRDEFGRLLIVLKEGVRKLHYPYTKEELDYTSDINFLQKLTQARDRANRIIAEDNDWN